MKIGCNPTVFLEVKQLYSHCQRLLKTTSELESTILHQTSAKCCSTIGRHKKALYHNREVSRIFRKLFPFGHPNRVLSLAPIANNFTDLEKHHKALEYHQKSLAARIRVYSEKSHITAEAYMSVGLCFLKLNDPNNALIHLEKALSICKSIKEPFVRPLTSKIHQHLASVYEANCNPQKAAYHYKKVKHPN